MKTYYLTFFTARSYCLTFKGTLENIYANLQENKEFICELWQKPEAEAMFYTDPQARYLWLMNAEQATYADILSNISTHGTLKPKKTISILERI